MILALGLTGCSNDDKNKEQEQNKPEPTLQEETIKDSNITSSEPIMEDVKELKEAGGKAQPNPKAFQSGKYVVGNTLPEGEYIILGNSPLGYFTVASSSEFKPSDKVMSEVLKTGKRYYVTLKDGQHLEVEGGEVFPVADAPSGEFEGGVYQDGMYLVGKDLPSGKYQVQLNEDTITGLGYVTISKSSSGEATDIVSEYTLDKAQDITLLDGQYLKLSGAYISTNK